MSKFREIETIPDAESGLVAIICVRDRNGIPDYSYSIQKEYERDGRVERTAWLKTRQCGGAIKLTHLVRARIDELEDRDRAADLVKAKSAVGG